ncbi:MAG: hypothetical protein N2376_10620 [Clostridia bacterium]|nr:hypothetical protein [Clostridia bacterium]
MIKTVLIVVGGVAVAAGAAVAGYAIYKKLAQAKAEELELQRAKEEFAANAAAFSGLYEPLYKMSKSGSKFRAGIIGDWSVRTENLENAEHYCGVWKEKLKEASSWDQEQGLAVVKELLDFVWDAGVCRDDTETVIVDGSTYKKYGTIDGELIEAGSEARVKSAFWFIEDKIVEKGVIGII